MKKIATLGILMLSCFIFTGCFGNNKDIVSLFKKKVEKSKNYYIRGNLSIINNEDKHLYSIEAAYKHNDNFRVSLKNKTNDHEQIILKNNEGVYVLTPSLNKSFKFQSEWPYNNSQSYLLQSLVTDIDNDKNRKVTENKDEYIITTKVNYSNNPNLIKQNIHVDKKGNIKKVEVIDKKGIVKIEMKYNKVDMKANYDKKYFDLNENMTSTPTTKETLKEIEDIIYPMYIPEDTYLESQDTIKMKDGERVILTFAGKSPFMIIEETVKTNKDDTVVSVYGDPVLMVDAIGNMSDNSANWISNGIEYYAVSEVLSGEELLEVINSISTIPISK